MLFVIDQIYYSYPEYLDIFHDVYAFMNYVMKSSLKIYFFVFDNVLDILPEIESTHTSEDLKEIDAFTFIKSCDVNKFPTKSEVYLSSSLFRKQERTQLKYTILHELVHAHGIMQSPFSKWNTMCSKNIYEQSSCLYKKHIHIDGNHIKGWKDCFSSYVKTHIHPDTFQLLFEYGYDVHFEHLNPILQQMYLK